MHQIFPNQRQGVAIGDAYAPLRDSAVVSQERPFGALCMLSSVDGSTSLKGLSGPLSGAIDRQILATLRSTADMIIVGAGTMRDEGYGPPRRRGQRIGVVTRTGAVDLGAAIFTSGAGFLIMPEDGPTLEVDTVRVGSDGMIDFHAAWHMLPESPQRLQIEGGPTLNSALFAADLIDEVNLTVSPAIVGGPGHRLAGTEQTATRRLALAAAFTKDEFLFLRYRTVR